MAVLQELPLRSLAAVLLLSLSLFAQTPAQPSVTKQELLWQKLEALVHEVDQNLDGVLGVYILDLTTGHSLALHADEVFPQASTIKLTVLADLYYQSQKGGPVKLTDVYTVQKSDLVPDSYIMGSITPGVTRLTNRDLAVIMVAVSDNSAANVLIDHVGMDNVNALMDSLGLKHTRLQRKMMDLKAAAEGRENLSTPHEMATLLADIYQGKLLNKSLADDLFQVLSTGKRDSALRNALPEDARSANKSGELEGVRNDCGVVYAARPFAMCVMTTYLHHEKDGEAAIARIAAAAFWMFDRLGRASDYGRVVSPGNSSPR
jgi:beta-lactamase class A